MKGSFSKVQSLRTQEYAQKLTQDKLLILSVLSLIIIGLLMVASSSMVISDRQYGHPLHFFLRQVMYLLLSIGISFPLLFVSMDRWNELSPLFLIITLISLILVLVPGMGWQVNGSSRWIHLGLIAIQVSEFAKIAMILFLSGYLVRRKEEVQNQFIGFLKPMLILGFTSTVLLLEPDFGATSVIMLVSLSMIFLAGARLWQFLLLLFLVCAAGGLLIWISPYRLQRLLTFLDPWAHPFQSGYQLIQSLIAFGRGGIWGVGLGNSIQKLFYLPEAHTDFIFAVLAEELGLIGQLSVCTLFSIVVLRALIIGRTAEKNRSFFSAYVAYGLGLWIGFQTFINIGVNLGLLPTKGLTLPFMSYGGSSMLVGCIAISLLLRIHYENHYA